MVLICFDPVRAFLCFSFSVFLFSLSLWFFSNSIFSGVLVKIFSFTLFLLIQGLVAMALGKGSMSPGDTYLKWAGELLASLMDEQSGLKARADVPGMSAMLDGSSAWVDGPGRSALDGPSGFDLSVTMYGAWSSSGKMSLFVGTCLLLWILRSCSLVSLQTRMLPWRFYQGSYAFNHRLWAIDWFV